MSQDRMHAQVDSQNDGHWHLQAGDPTVLGWLTLAGYLLAALACWRASQTCRFSARMLDRVHVGEAVNQLRLAAWWVAAGVLMLAIGLNKELDLQTLIGEWGKQMALEQGWYPERRSVQRLFALLFGAALLAGLGAAAFLLRHVLDRIVPALTGIALVFVYIGGRAALFLVLRDGPGAGLLSIIWPLELVGIALMAWSAWRAAQPGRGVRA
jgi:hypothetical protein